MSTQPPPNERELLRQQALMAAIRGPAQPGEPPGLQAYRGHIRVVAGQVLQHTYPTVTAMVGEEAMAALGWHLWLDQGPTTGDLNEWGQGLSALLAEKVVTSPDWHAWPCLIDVAHLDWACHQCERARDAPPELDTLPLLGEIDPDQLDLVLRPGVQCLQAHWPLWALWQAHQKEASPDALQALAPRLQQPLSEPEWLVVWRAPEGHLTSTGAVSPWVAQVAPLPASMAAWMSVLCLAAPRPGHERLRPTLAQLLDAQAADFDFTAWLTLALQQGWLWRVRNRADGNRSA
jgi:hypothetical protein